MTKKSSETLKQNLLGTFPLGQYTIVVQGVQGCISYCMLNLVMSESHLGNTSFEGMKRSWRPAEDWLCVAGLKSLKRGQESPLVKV